MDARTKELVSIGASVAGHCQPCFKHHYAKAIELGISIDEVREAVAIASHISGVGDTRMAEFVEETIKKTD